MSILTTLRRRKRRFYKALFLGFAVSLLLTLGSSLGYLDFIEAKALDFLMLVRGQQRSPEIVLVTIDDHAFEQLGEKQPLSRSYIANLIEVVARGGARVIGLDIEFKVPTDPKEDQRLLQAIERTEHGGTSKVVLTYVVRPEKEDAAGLLYRRPPFFAALNTVAGFANAAVDVDGFVRQVPVALRASDGAVIPSLGWRHSGAPRVTMQKLWHP